MHSALANNRNIPLRGGKYLPRWCNYLLHKFGWRIEGQLPEHESRFIIILAPHTSNWDFIVGVAAIFALDVKLTGLGKASLFWWPFSVVMRFLGFLPIDRQAKNGQVGMVKELFDHNQHFILAMAPEGTRSAVGQWKTGFYHMAVAANVPIVGVGFDFPCKTIHLHSPFWPSANIDKDMPVIRSHFESYTGKQLQ